MIRCTLVALVALLATGLPQSLLCWTLMSNLAPDASTLSSYLPFTIEYPVPAWGRDLLAAARAFAALRNDGPNEPLLATGIGRGGHILADTAQRCGLRLGEFMLSYRRDGWHVQARCSWVAPPLHPRAPVPAKPPPATPC